jgi:cobalt-precorrin 5A hydrolase
MKIAILSVSNKGWELSKKIYSLLSEDSTVIKVNLYHKDVKNTITNIFNSYDIIIGIMATGILIRSIATMIHSKYEDPGIIAIDENGKHVISLLSGHIGRANEISEKIAILINGQAVITTATDTSSKIGIDTLCNKFYFQIENKLKILIFNKAILDEKKICLIGNFDFSYIKSYIESFHNNFTLETDLSNNNLKDRIGEYNLKNPFNMNKDNKIIAILKSNSYNSFDEIIAIKPKKMVLGIGSRKNISIENVLLAINKAIKDLNLPVNRIDLLSTGSMKKNEKGIAEASKILKKPLCIVDIEELRNFKCEYCSKSSFVKEKFGIEGVCEQSALIVAGNGSKLIYRKTAFKGVTIAIAIK